jgi:hypothetical protein
LSEIILKASQTTLTHRICQFDAVAAQKAIEDLGINPEKGDPAKA